MVFTTRTDAAGRRLPDLATRRRPLQRHPGSHAEDAGWEGVTRDGSSAVDLMV